jgi:hypothetical protein
MNDKLILSALLKWYTARKVLDSFNEANQSIWGNDNILSKLEQLQNEFHEAEKILAETVESEIL